MKVGKTGLKMSSGEIRHFGSSQKRDNFERVAQAYKHGWRPSYKNPRHSHPFSHNPKAAGKCLICGRPQSAHTIDMP